MPDIMNLHRPQHELLIRHSKESPRPSKCEGFPEYLKHTDLLGDGVNRLKLTASNSLFHCVLKGRVRSTEYMLDRGTTINGRNDYGFSVLTAALHIDNAKRRDNMFRLLLDRGADPHFKDVAYDRTVLHWACLLGRTHQVRDLLQEVAADADLNAKDRDSYTALHHAVMAGHLPVVRLLVDMHRRFGVTVDVADRMGLTPYLHAKRLGYRDVAEYLHTEGLASSGHGDLQFRTPREWSQIGKFERRKAIEIHTQEAINIAKIRGRLAHARSLQPSDGLTSSPRMAAPNLVLPSYWPEKQPGVKLAIRHADRLSVSLPSLQQQQAPQQPFRPSSVNGAGHDGVDYGPGRKHNGQRPPFIPQPKHAFVDHHTIGPSQPRGQPLPLPMPLSQAPAAGTTAALSGSELTVPSGQGPGGTAALTLMEMHSEARHAITYRQSQFDETKASEYQHMLGNLNTIMDMLSQQQSKSFRQSVKYVRPETPKKVKPKNKVSSLAVIFGRGKGSRRKKGGRSPKPSAGKKKAAGKKKEKEKGGGEEKKAKGSDKKKAVPLLKVNDKVV